MWFEINIHMFGFTSENWLSLNNFRELLRWIKNLIKSFSINLLLFRIKKHPDIIHITSKSILQIECMFENPLKNYFWGKSTFVKASRPLFLLSLCFYPFDLHWSTCDNNFNCKPNMHWISSKNQFSKLNFIQSQFCQCSLKHTLSINNHWRNAWITKHTSTSIKQH